MRKLRSGHLPSLPKVTQLVMSKPRMNPRVFLPRQCSTPWQEWQPSTSRLPGPQARCVGQTLPLPRGSQLRVSKTSRRYSKYKRKGNTAWGHPERVRADSCLHSLSLLRHIPVSSRTLSPLLPLPPDNPTIYAEAESCYRHTTSRCVPQPPSNQMGAPQSSERENLMGPPLSAP